MYTRNFFASLFVSMLLAASTLKAQQRITGPVIPDFGAVYAVDSPDFETDTSQVYRVVFDVYQSPEDPAALNPQLNTLARFLNMHAQAGVARQNMQLACVIHNQATKDAMSSQAYREKYGVPNPNEALLKALAEAGVGIYLCGQSMHARGLERDRLAPGVQLALSAMTVILKLQMQGYHLIKF
ncbi:MAG: hypothetical protein D6730_17980 [Bacteroidetes bacterium]|nr:MAG: hypothetical protein D6730_17980 [Bacteroidota bacterium]